MTKNKTKNKIGETNKSKEKRIDGFGMFKGIGKFKREKEEHDEFW